VLPGRVSLDDGRARFHDHWSTVPSGRGLDTEGILRAAADGKLDVLVLLGADPLSDFPDHDLARRALAGARTVVAVDILENPSVAQADVVLPAAGYTETDGTTTNLEGRISRLSQKVTPPGTARADWVIAAELAYRLGDDLRLESLDDIFTEMAAVAPSHHGLTLEHVAIDGVLVPLQRDHGADSHARTAAEPQGIHTAGGDQEPDPDIDPQAAAAVAESEAADTDGGTTEAEVEATEAQAAAEAADAATPDDEGDGAGPVDRAETQAASAELPSPIRFHADAVRPPEPGGYSLRLLTTRKLYDLGTATQASRSLAKLAPGAVLHLHPHDFDRLGVSADAQVTVSNRDAGRGSLTVPVRSSAAVPKGAALLAFLQPGGHAAELIDASALVTDVRVEVAR
jgi:predicted molibdopterin-dependent oxidoreductase YjgC